MKAESTTEIEKPPALEAGDRVAVVAPASQVREAYLLRGIAELERLGFRPTFRPDILARGRYTAGDDRRRTDELIEAFTDPTVKAVWAARGGYGSMRMLGLLDRPEVMERLRCHPKIFIGYSDLTALHLFFYKRLNLVTFHGPMVARDLADGGDHYDRATLLQSISHGETPREILSPRTTILHHGSGETVTGRLLGGCLSLIVSLLGTPYELPTAGSILFLEDTGTKPYAIDRMLQQLRLAGSLDGVRGLIFGEMSDCVQHEAQGYRIEDVLSECTADLGIPVLFGLPSGHSPSGNLTLPLGIAASLDIDRQTLRIEESAVRPVSR